MNFAESGESADALSDIPLCRDHGGMVASRPKRSATYPPFPVSPAMARILLVDDEASVRELMAIVLEAEGYSVTKAGDGNSALAALERESFDLVITDLVMPGKEGIETIMDIRQRWPQLKVIAMSGGGRGSANDYLDMAAQLGARRTLEKPFGSEDLVALVAEVLKGA